MKRSFCGNIFLILCVSGLVFQVVSICMRYFRYPVRTKVSLNLGSYSSAPTTTFCGRYWELLDNHRLLQERSIQIWDQVNETKQFLRSSELSKVTVKDIMDYTPPAEKMLRGCRMREVSRKRNVGFQSLGKCLKAFNIRKFVMQSYICYNFEPRESFGKFFTQEISQSYDFELNLYVLRLSSQLISSSNFVVVGPESYPYISRYFGTYIVNRKNRDPAVDILIENKPRKTVLQPPPYETMCSETKEISDDRDCLIQALSERGVDRVPMTEILTEPYTRPPVLEEDELNKTRKALIDDAYKVCNDLIFQTKCEISFAETHVTVDRGSIFGGSIILRVMGPNVAFEDVMTEPGFEFPEFFLQICSSAGVWLGLSISHLNLFHFLHWIWKRYSGSNRAKDGDWVRVRPQQQVFVRNEGWKVVTYSSGT